MCTLYVISANFDPKKYLLCKKLAGSLNLPTFKVNLMNFKLQSTKATSDEA